MSPFLHVVFDKDHVTFRHFDENDIDKSGMFGMTCQQLCKSSSLHKPSVGWEMSADNDWNIPGEYLILLCVLCLLHKCINVFMALPPNYYVIWL